MKKNAVPAGRQGFTLVEMIIAVTIVVVLAVIMISVFNSMGAGAKALDAQRKKDLNRIKVAFEEYYNDKGCYPDEAMVSDLNLQSNCKTNVFSPWVSNWPCDPIGIPYIVLTGNESNNTCNNWYKVLTNLENKKDGNIPFNWYGTTTYSIGESITSAMVNYGVSSSNINWSTLWVNPECSAYGGCYYKPDPVDQPNVCNSAGTGCVGPNCYLGICKDSCVVACCGRGCK